MHNHITDKRWHRTMTRAFDAAHRTHRARRQAVVLTEKGGAEAAPPDNISHVWGRCRFSVWSSSSGTERAHSHCCNEPLFWHGGRFGGEKYLQWSDAKRIACQAEELESGVRECISQLVSESHRFGLKYSKKKFISSSSVIFTDCDGLVQDIFVSLLLRLNIAWLFSLLVFQITWTGTENTSACACDDLQAFAFVLELKLVCTLSSEHSAECSVMTA